MAKTGIGIEISELRKRLRLAIEQSRRAGEARREVVDRASAAYERFLPQVAGPVVQMLANALRAEGFPCTVFTPNRGLRLSSGQTGEDFIEFLLDSTGDRPVVVLRVNRGRGRRVVQHERPLSAHEDIDQITDEDVVKALLEEISAFVSR